LNTSRDAKLREPYDANWGIEKAVPGVLKNVKYMD
jgi:hypothetical protein